jgi:hypothetical protein
MNSSKLSNVTSSRNPEQLEAVLGWLIEGHKDSDVREAILAKWPDANPVELQIAASEHFARAAHCERDVLIGFALESYREIYRQTLKIGDYSRSMQALKEMVKLTADVHEPEDDEEDDTTEATDDEGTQTIEG